MSGKHLTGRGVAVAMLAYCVATAGYAAEEAAPTDPGSSADRADRADRQSKPGASTPGKPDLKKAPPAKAESNAVSDPLQPLNRAMFTVNDRLYFYVLKPVAQGYKKIAPKPVRNGLDNFFYNLTFPGRAVNDLLQAKVKRAGKETAQFLVNSTVGVLGFMTPAQDRLGLNPPSEDTGQSFGTWGIPRGPYLVLPVLGPSHTRHTVGRVGDYFLDPITYLDPVLVRLGIRSVDRVNQTSLRIGNYEAIKESALDPYTAVKDGYHQRRSKQVRE